MTRIATAAIALLLLGPTALIRAQDPAPTITGEPAGPATTEGSAESFDAFLAGIRTDARARGISEATLDRALTGLLHMPVVVTRDRAQPENVQSLDAYLAERLTRQRVATARQMRTRHARVLADVESAYGVPAPIMVSIWGLESNFGRFTGTYSTIRALATLAYDNRRPLFRAELLSAIEMVDKNLVTLDAMKGSWAGAMGQPQFMPSSFLRHAVDFDGDGRIDIWQSMPDVFGSMANYLRQAGWTSGERWGREVRVTRAVRDRIDREVPMRSGGCRAVREMTVDRPLDDWRDLGVTLVGGAPLPRSTMRASLVRGARRNFLVYRNYEAIIDYNCSHSYALAAGLLADAIN